MKQELHLRSLDACDYSSNVDNCYLSLNDCLWNYKIIDAKGIKITAWFLLCKNRVPLKEMINCDKHYCVEKS